MFRSPSSLHTRPFTESTPFAFGGQGQDDAENCLIFPAISCSSCVCLFISKRFARDVKNKRRGAVIFVPPALLASHPPFHGANALRFRRSRAGRCGKLPHLPCTLPLFLRLPFHKQALWGLCFALSFQKANVLTSGKQGSDGATASFSLPFLAHFSPTFPKEDVFCRSAGKSKDAIFSFLPTPRAFAFSKRERRSRPSMGDGKATPYL